MSGTSATDAALTRIDLDLLYLPFTARIVELVTTLAAMGRPFVATSGFRSLEQQSALYAQGRTAPGKIVTKSPGGYSAHNYGCAVDLCADADAATPGLQPNWSSPAYDVLGVEAAKLGLEWGGTWRGISDRPHVQVPLRRLGFDMDRLIAIKRLGGMEYVWAALDQAAW